MKILAIDTSCDDTAAAVTAGNRVLSNVIWSQASLHAKWGGVVPSLAKRAHQERLPLIVAAALSRAKVRLPHVSHESHKTHESHFPISALAVTIGPGLAPALEAGIHYAKQLALLHKIPLIPVNHLEGHIISSLATPHESHETHETHLTHAFSLIVSGGHTQLCLSPSNPSNPSFPSYRLLAETLDDALGEALDKAARMLGLGYPGGAVLEKFAKHGDPKKSKLPLPLLGREDQGHFSFSGLKTAFYRLIEGRELNQQEICDLAASFQSTAFDHVVRIIRRTIKREGSDPSVSVDGSDPSIRHLLVGGGVAANLELRKRLRKLAKEFGLKVHFPYSKNLCTDNAAMIGLAASYAYNRGEICRTKEEILALDRQPNLTLYFPKMPKTQKDSPVDPSIKSAYEVNPFDPLAQIRMTGRFLGSIVRYDRKMNPIVLIGSIILGAGFLLLGIFGNTPLNVLLGAVILLNVSANLKKPAS